MAATKKKAPATKKPKEEAKKPAAKKAAPAGGKKAPAKKKPAEATTEARRTRGAADGQREVSDRLPAEAVTGAVEPADIEDAEILAETPAEEQSGEIEAPPVQLSDEEKELQSLYGDDLNAPAVAHGEYKDRQTKDEDRPMLPEINARDERNKRWDDRRDQRRRRRDERDQRREQRRNEQGGAPSGQQQLGFQQPNREQRPDSGPRHDGGQRPHEPRPQHGNQPMRPLQPPVQVTADDEQRARVGTPLGDAAATVFAQLRNGQPLPLRQLAQMMRKRNLVEVEPDQLAPQLKAELLGDERSYKALGLRPRIVYRGRDLFAPGPVAMSVTADAEAGLAAALSRLAGATHRALAQRVAKASPAGFERLIHAYLVGAGYRDIEWVKRLGGISYASATAPGIDRQVLISARSGDEPIDRRGIGELRVGVEAKNLVAGVLFAARELSEDAERELERAGRSIAVICGDQLVAALVATGVGVVSAAAPMHYVDDQLLDELLAG